MKKLLLLLPIVLSGCLATTQPTNVMPKWPDVPKEIFVACPDLELVDKSKTEFSDILNVVSDNYTSYKECRLKVDSWIQWYTVQKKIYETVR